LKFPKNLNSLHAFLFYKVYVPARIAWPTDVLRHQAWREREDGRIAAEMQAAFNAGEFFVFRFQFFCVKGVEMFDSIGLK
jgi:hypothetical protein